MPDFSPKTTRRRAPIEHRALLGLDVDDSKEAFDICRSLRIRSSPGNLLDTVLSDYASGTTCSPQPPPRVPRMAGVDWAKHNGFRSISMDSVNDGVACGQLSNRSRY